MVFGCPYIFFGSFSCHVLYTPWSVPVVPLYSSQVYQGVDTPWVLIHTLGFICYCGCGVS